MSGQSKAGCGGSAPNCGTVRFEARAGEAENRRRRGIEDAQREREREGLCKSCRSKVTTAEENYLSFWLTLAKNEGATEESGTH